MRTLLIAEDEEGIRALVKMTLARNEYEILEAVDGEEALALAREHRPELILLDVMMPGLSGFEVCRALKDDPTTAQATVVMLSARSQEADREQGMASGADDYFTKPFSPIALLRKIDEVYRRDES
jgi:two-component system, OmpR family, phosphate regulon response regulator PhoB